MLNQSSKVGVTNPPKPVNISDYMKVLEEYGLPSSKLCVACNTTKSFTAFVFDKTNGKITSHCRSCRAVKTKRWRALEARRDNIAEKQGTITEKWCNDCETVQPTSNFYTSKSTKSGYQVYCKACSSLRVKKETKSGGHRRRIYGIGLEEYHKILEKQNNCCAICKETFREGKTTHVDHDHTTKQNRDLLCARCNTGLGRIEPVLKQLFTTGKSDYLDYLLKHGFVATKVLVDVKS